MVKKYFFLALFMILGCFVDMLDGAVARKFHKSTLFGGFLDSFFDRISDFLYISAFSYSHIVRWEISMPLVLFSFLISYMRSRVSGIKQKPMPGFLQRTERIVGLFITLLSYILFPYAEFFGFNSAELIFVALLFFALLTCIQRFLFIYNQKEKLSS